MLDLLFSVHGYKPAEHHVELGKKQKLQYISQPFFFSVMEYLSLANDT